jgi:hypothetical protein
LNAQNRKPDSAAAAGSVNTHAIAISRTVYICKPLLFAAIVPAIPEDNIGVVLTGKP